VTCAVVPARGGSKGIPRKNLKLLAGRPLIAYAIETGLKARLVDRVIVSTDDAEIAAVAREWGAAAPFLRPASLAQDDTPTAPMLQHAVRWMEEQGERIDLVVLLQPTSPFRRPEHVDQAIQLLRESGASSAVSVCEVEHSPHWMYRLADQRLEPLMPGALNRTRRQELPLLYRLNGAVYVTTRDLLLNDGRILDDRPAAVVMSREESVDIDDELDFEWAEWMAARSAHRR